MTLVKRSLVFRQTAGETSASANQAARFEDACKVAELLGFTHSGGQGSHRAFGRPDEPDLLNFQDRGGTIPPYHARQLIRMMDKYGEQDDEVSD